MSDWIIEVADLGKRYRLRHAQQGRYVALRDVITERFKRVFSGVRPPQPISCEEFWALRDVTFEVKPGEVVGIIGRNGAGKSTLLKLLSRITEPSCGRIRLSGRVASLLEVGTGFHNELTGRENIFLNGAILGMTNFEIKRKFDEIVAFSDVEKFLDTPVKHYSSGMYVRLAFAVAAHLEPEILIVDEVLAVGDLAFQKKCLGKMKDVSKSGRTVLFVSHNMAAVRTLCTRAIVLQEGHVLCDHNDPSDAIAMYVTSGSAPQQVWHRLPGERPQGPMVFRSMLADLLGEQPRHQLRIVVELDSLEPHAPALLAFDILDSGSVPIMQALPSIQPLIPYDPITQKIEVLIDLPPLIPGNYQITAWVGQHNTLTYDLVPSALSFEVLASPTQGRSFPHTQDHGHIVPDSTLTLLAVEQDSKGKLCPP
jgi:lipopolysaccharide transport system ATP-binding protein